jgi:2-phosphoglycerate kinase
VAEAYFIGGTPRVGKTTLTIKVIQEKPMMATSTDAIRYTLRQILKKDDYPDLFHLGKYTSNDPRRRKFIINNPEEIINIQNRESEVVWKSVNDFVKSNLEDGFDVLIEGIAVLPELLDKVDYDYKAIFLGNQSETHYDTILKSARNNEDDWMHELEDETIKAFAVFNASFSKHIANEANKYNMTYIEIGDDTFTEDINSALVLLLHS